MTTMMPQPPTAGPTWPEAIDQEQSTDAVLTALMGHIIQLEAAVTSRRARRHLRRQLASSARSYAWAGSFPAARWEAFSAGRISP